MKSRITMLAVVVAAMLAAGQSVWGQYGPPPGAAGYGYPPPGGQGYPYGAQPAAYDPGMAPSVLAPGGMGPGPMGPPMGPPPGPMGPMGPGGPPPGGPGLAPVPYDPGSGQYMDQSGGCDPSLLDGGCGPASRLWIDTEYLLWYTHGRSLPPLVTTSPLGTNQDVAGELGEPTTSILFGGNQVGDNVGNGFRFTSGLWFDQNHENALMLRFWYLDGNEAAFSRTEIGPDREILAIPFFNTDANEQQAILVSFQDPDIPFDLSEGSVNIRDTLEIISGEVLGRFALEKGCGYRVDFLGGFQSQRINNGLNINYSLVSLDPGGTVAVGTVIEGNDFFNAKNHFNGGVVGLTGEWQRGPWLLRALGKCGIGNMNQRVQISGNTTVTEPNQLSVTTPGGIFSQPSNIGTETQDKICFAPELNLTLCYQATCHIDLSVGYSFSYWSSVAMAGSQIDQFIDPTQATTNPAFAFRNTDLWTQGGNIGILVHW